MIYFGADRSCHAPNLVQSPASYYGPWSFLNGETESTSGLDVHVEMWMVTDQWMACISVV